MYRLFQLGRAITVFCLGSSLFFSCSPPIPEEVEIALEELPEEIDYNFHVKPILADRCYACHGPDEGSRKAGLRLDIEKEAFMKLASGKRAFSKGSLGGSEAFHRMVSLDPESVMPPPESNLTLTPEEIAIIVKWVEQGAEWKQHWSFIGVEKPGIPEADENWVQENPIDNFIQTELQRREMTPSPKADKERLLRRVAMDLTGLPPTIDEIDDFLKDDSPKAYERVVDRLLKTEAHAERLAMEWLDVARYSDSHGVSFDGYREMWPYRDWVIQAFQDNIPHSEFITKQVAGDLLPNSTDQDKLATAFYRLNPMEASAGSIDEEYRVEYVAERTSTTATAFLGLTMACARCHDHKFDPISQKNFFQLSAFFNSVDEYGLGATDLNRAPTLLLYSDEQRNKLDSLDQLITEKKSEIEKASIRDYVAELGEMKAPTDGQTFPLDSYEKIKREKKRENPFAEEEAEEYKMLSAKEKAKVDSTKKANKKKKKKKEYEEVYILDKNKVSEATLGVQLTDGKFGQAVILDEDYDYVSLNKTGFYELSEPFSASLWINPDPGQGKRVKNIIGNSSKFGSFFRGWEFIMDSTDHLSLRLIHRLPDDFMEVVTEAKVPTEEWTQVSFTYDGSGEAAGIQIFINGEQEQVRITEDKLTRSILPIHIYTSKLDTIPLQIGKSYREFTGDPGLFRGKIDEVKLFDRSLTEAEMKALAGKDVSNLSKAEIEEYFKSRDKELIGLNNELRDLIHSKTSLLSEVQEVMVMEDMKEPRQTYLLNRGLYNQHGEKVETSTPENILPYPEDYPKNRLGLAMWLTDPENPLPSRVIINRYWQMIFGTGLVKSTGDFGIQGDLPSHPELLDWLAAEFIESDWDLRHMLKLMVMSATYQQSSFATEEKYQLDPDNIYLSRSSSYRLPAEFIRDNALASSGLLVDEKGGPSAKPYQPKGLWKELGDFSFKLHKYKADTGANLYRRSLYTFSRRFSPSPFMITFDAGNREFCITRRVNTNTPLQALNLLNDPQFVEASKILSERVIKEADSLDEQLELGFRLSTGMTPSDDLLATLRDHYHSAFDHFKENPLSADSLLSVGARKLDPNLDHIQAAALTMVANTIYNFDETYMKR